MIFFIVFGFSSLLMVFAGDVSVQYQTHVQNIGWQDNVSNGTLAGTTGVGLRLEAFRVYLGNLGSNDLGVSYRSHVQDIGWQDWVNSNELSGTEGQGKRLEAIEIQLTGANSQDYNIYYRTHVQDLGWLAWAKNGETSGTTGMSKRLEAIEIKVLPNTEGAPVSQDSKERADYTVSDMGFVHYKTHVSGLGWQDYSYDGQESGTTGLSHSLEALSVGLTDGLAQGESNGLTFQAQVHNVGWTEWVSNDQTIGTEDESLPMQAIRMRLTGDLQNQYDIYYRSHVANVGWLDWAKNGKTSGALDVELPMESVQICIVKKNDNPPGATSKPYVSEKVAWIYPLDDYHKLSSEFGPRNGSSHDGVDFPAPTGTPIKAVAPGKVYFTGGEDNGKSYGYNVRIENETGEHVIYAHMSKISAVIGQQVKAGDIIGYVGSTGNSTGPHLHLEVSVPPSYKLVDPMTYYEESE